MYSRDTAFGTGGGGGGGDGAWRLDISFRHLLSVLNRVSFCRGAGNNHENKPI